MSPISAAAGPSKSSGRSSRATPRFFPAKTGKGQRAYPSNDVGESPPPARRAQYEPADPTIPSYSPNAAPASSNRRSVSRPRTYSDGAGRQRSTIGFASLPASVSLTASSSGGTNSTRSNGPTPAFSTSLRGISMYVIEWSPAARQSSSTYHDGASGRPSPSFRACKQ